MENEDFRVDSRARVISILNGLRLERTRLAVTLEGMEEEWHTTLLKVDPEGDVLYFSLVGVPRIDERLHDGEPFQVSGVLRGVPLVMTLRSDVADGQWFASDILRVPVPDELIYMQKRESVRVPIHDPDFDVTLSFGAWRGVGQLADISFSGCRVVMDLSVVDGRLSAGNEATLTWEFPGASEAVEIAVQVVHIEAVEEDAYIGMMFGKTDLRTQNLIDRYVLEKQRNACRVGQASLA